MLQIAEDVVDLLDYSWMTNFNDPNFGLVVQGLRYYVPVEYDHVPVVASYWDATPGIGVKWGDSPLGGAHTFLTGGLHHLAEMTNDSSVRTRAENYGGHLLGTLSESGRWNKWEYCIPKQYAQ